MPGRHRIATAVQVGTDRRWRRQNAPKFIVIDFDKPTARVYMGSYNFSLAADTSNGENLQVIRERGIAVSYMIEALRLFDHYHTNARNILDRELFDRAAGGTGERQRRNADRAVDEGTFSIRRSIE